MQLYSGSLLVVTDVVAVFLFREWENNYILIQSPVRVSRDDSDKKNTTEHYAQVYKWWYKSDAHIGILNDFYS